MMYLLVVALCVVMVFVAFFCGRWSAATPTPPRVSAPWDHGAGLT